MKKHGSFRLNDNNTVSGPSDYMNQRYPQFMEECRNGTNPSLLSVLYCTSKDEDDDSIFLRSIQLDYANWHGVDSLIKSLRD